MNTAFNAHDMSALADPVVAIKRSGAGPACRAATPRYRRYAGAIAKTVTVGSGVSEHSPRVCGAGCSKKPDDEEHPCRDQRQSRADVGKGDNRFLPRRSARGAALPCGDGQ